MIQRQPFARCRPGYEDIGRTKESLGSLIKPLGDTNDRPWAAGKPAQMHDYLIMVGGPWYPQIRKGGEHMDDEMGRIHTTARI